MRLKQNGVTLLLGLLLLAVGYGVWRTSQQSPAAQSGARVTRDASLVVDQGSLTTAEQLLRIPMAVEERPLAEDVLRLADQEMDLAFAQAVRQAANRPRAVTAEAQQIDHRLQQALGALAADQAQTTEITSAASKANATTAQSLNDRLDLVRAQVALDQDEVDDARADLQRAGGDPQGRMQAMLAEHEAASRSSDSIHVNITTTAGTRGLITYARQWQALDDKQRALERAKALADSLASAFQTRHDRLKARAAARLRQSPDAHLSHDSSTSLLAATKLEALSQKARATLDQRVDNQHKLADLYTGWMVVVANQERAVINRALRDVALILAIVLIGMLLARWTEHVLGMTAMEHRRARTLYMVTRASLQVLAVLLILLVVFGPPDNLATFLGLAGAGLTVALKDFIIAFIGWFVLMGKNGIRIGDLVEINGVTGEVLELGMFYTVLLETGNWNESGHPTGRRVSFANGYAIEGHYFNFSTAGQWLWDEVRIVVPAGLDPYRIVEAIQKQVEEATADSARQAEAEWQQARRSPHFETLTAAPTLSVKPIAGGVEITVRYITRVAERAELRAKLYHTAVSLLGSADEGPTAPAASAAPEEAMPLHHQPAGVAQP